MRATSALIAWFASQRSTARCAFIQNSGDVPKNRASRRAVSAVIPALFEHYIVDTRNRHTQILCQFRKTSRSASKNLPSGFRQDEDSTRLRAVFSVSLSNQLQGEASQDRSFLPNLSQWSQYCELLLHFLVTGDDLRRAMLFSLPRFAHLSVNARGAMAKPRFSVP